MHEVGPHVTRPRRRTTPKAGKGRAPLVGGIPPPQQLAHHLVVEPDQVGRHKTGIGAHHGGGAYTALSYGAALEYHSASCLFVISRE